MLTIMVRERYILGQIAPLETQHETVLCSRTHTGVKPFKCQHNTEICTVAFTTKQCLQVSNHNCNIYFMFFSSWLKIILITSVRYYSTILLKVHYRKVHNYTDSNMPTIVLNAPTNSIKVKYLVLSILWDCDCNQFRKYFRYPSPFEENMENNLYLFKVLL